MKTSKAFLASGWAIVKGGDAIRAMGSALASFLFVGSHGGSGMDRASRLGTWRITVGKRISKIQARRHGTPTGRCSRGHWVTEWSGDTPQGAAEWNQFGPFASWFVGASPEERKAYVWTDNPLGDPNRCQTLPGKGRGRKGRDLPTKKDTLGHSPANGRKVATHNGPRHPEAPPPRPDPRPVPNRAKAFSRANQRRLCNTERLMVSATFAQAADATREEIRAHANKLREAAGGA